MSATAFWGTVAVAGLGTFLLRASFLTFVGDRPLPDWLRRALRHVPAAVLSALVVPAVLRVDQRFAPLNAGALAAAVAALVAWRTRSVLATLGVGMGTFWVVRALS